MNGNIESSPVTATSGPFNSVSAAGLSLASPRWQEVYGVTRLILSHELQKLRDSEDAAPSFFGLSNQQIIDKHAAAKKMSTREPRIKNVSDNLRGYSFEELAGFMHIESITGRLWTGAHVIAERNQQNLYYGSHTFDRELRKQTFAENARMLKDLGFSARDAALYLTDFFSGEKQWPTFTPHPTKDKNELGEKLYRLQTSITDSHVPENRSLALQGVIGEMLRGDITPRKKDTFDDETVDGLATQEIYNTGLVNCFQDMQSAMDEVFGKGAVDFLSDDMLMDVASRKWHGGDADGKKVRATTLFNQRVQDALVALRFYNKYLADQNLSGKPGQEQLGAPVDAFRQIEAKLESLHARAKEIYDAGSAGPEFEAAKQEFVDAFMGIEYKGETFDSGPKLTARIIQDVRALAYDDTVNGEVKAAAWNVSFLHKQNGIAMGRTELRHNNEDYKEIFDRLYKYIKANQPGVIIEPEESFLDFPEESRRVLLKRLMVNPNPKNISDEEHNKKLSGWLLAAVPHYSNEAFALPPEEFCKLNWPADVIERFKEEGGKLSKEDLEDLNWPREILERFRMVRKCYNHSRMGTSIIAEADGVGQVMQQFIAQSFGNENMVHIPLNENIETLENARKNFESNARVVGKINLEGRANGNGNGNGQTEMDFKNLITAFYAVMDPQSDSQKSHSVIVRMLQLKTGDDFIDYSLKNLVGVLLKRGTGSSHSRGGTSPKTEILTLLNIIGRYQQKLGREFTDKEKHILHQMTSFVSTTIQGRDVGLRYGTPEQVYDMTAGLNDEMFAARLAIDGYIPMDLVTEMPVEHSPEMRAVIVDIRKELCREYETDLRNGRSKIPGKLNQNRSDHYINEVSASKMSTFAGVGARPPSRKKKDLWTGDRAIGANIKVTNTETNFDGSYFTGKFLEKIHEKYKEGRIKREDLVKLSQDKFYITHALNNAYAALADSNYEYGFDRLTTDGLPANWTVGDTQKQKNQDYADFRDNAAKFEKIAFHTVLANDAISASAYMEALLHAEEGGYDLSHREIISRVFPSDSGFSQLHFGERTRGIYPDIDQIQAYASEKQLSRGIIHEIEDRVRLYAVNPADPNAINPDDPKNREMLHHVACAARNMGPFNMNSLLHQPGSSFGARHSPVMERIRHYIYQPGPPANDLEAGPEADSAVA